MSNIAATIQQQLGNQTFAMLGAYNLMDHGDALGFRFRGCRNANHVKIALAADDTYTLTFCKVVKWDVRNEDEVPGVYADSLRAVIEDKTGLYTRL